MPTPTTFDRISWPRRTERLVLRVATIADLPALSAIQVIPEVGRWLPSLPASHDAFVLDVGRAGLLARMVVVEVDTVVIGHLYLHVGNGWAQSDVEAPAVDSQAEIGWSLDPAHQGRGYATEGVTELVRVCFEALGVRRVTAVAFADNAPSLAVMERLGMRREARHVQESYHRDLGWVDSVTYALLADEWRAAQGRAEPPRPAASPVDSR